MVFELKVAIVIEIELLILIWEKERK